MINCCSAFDNGNTNDSGSARGGAWQRGQRTEHPLVVISHNASQSTIFEHTIGSLLIASQLKRMVVCGWAALSVHHRHHCEIRNNIVESNTPWPPQWNLNTIFNCTLANLFNLIDWFMDYYRQSIHLVRVHFKSKTASVCVHKLNSGSSGHSKSIPFNSTSIWTRFIAIVWDSTASIH